MPGAELVCFEHLQSKPASCWAACGWQGMPGPRAALGVLGRVVGGQLLVALKVGGTCLD